MCIIHTCIIFEETYENHINIYYVNHIKQNIYDCKLKRVILFTDLRKTLIRNPQIQTQHKQVK